MQHFCSHRASPLTPPPFTMLFASVTIPHILSQPKSQSPDFFRKSWDNNTLENVGWRFFREGRGSGHRRDTGPTMHPHPLLPPAPPLLLPSNGGPKWNPEPAGGGAVARPWPRPGDFLRAREQNNLGIKYVSSCFSRFLILWPRTCFSVFRGFFNS